MSLTFTLKDVSTFVWKEEECANTGASGKPETHQRNECCPLLRSVSTLVVLSCPHFSRPVFLN
eukprot:988057-Pelagomonas_calceolata.AAC.3